MSHDIDLKTVRESLTESKAESLSINTPYSYYVLGDISERLVPLFIRRGWSANRITGLSLVVLLVGLLFLVGSAWSRWCVFLAGVLLHGVLILDNVDGYVARITRTESKVGNAADSFVTWFQLAVLPLCLGLGLSASAPEWWSSALPISPWIWIAMGVVRSVFYLLTVVMSNKAQKLLGVEGYQSRVRSQRGLVALKGLLEAEPLLLILAPIWEVVGLAHLGYAVLHLLVFFGVMGKSFVDLLQADEVKDAPQG